MIERKIPGAVDVEKRDWHDLPEWKFMALLQATHPDDEQMRDYIWESVHNDWATWQTADAMYRRKRGA